MDQELKDYLDRQSDYLERQFGEAREFRKETNRQFSEIRDEIRGTRVLVEKLNDKIDLVAEGVESNTQVMHRLFEENRQERHEQKTVIEAAHRHLEHRVSKHDVEIAGFGRRVRRLEA